MCGNCSVPVNSGADRVFTTHRKEMHDRYPGATPLGQDLYDDVTQDVTVQPVLPGGARLKENKFTNDGLKHLAGLWNLRMGFGALVQDHTYPG
jgi:hypothetical protein